MSLFDQVKNSLTGAPAGTDHASLINAAMQMFGHQQGLSGLAQNFESAGLGHIFGSWVGAGANQPVSTQQVQSAVGQNRIEEFAAKAGIPAGIAPQLLATVLPTLIDRLTPHARMPSSDTEIPKAS
jgi:uncharacterized protein YidB (DUF937 family)